MGADLEATHFAGTSCSVTIFTIFSGFLQGKSNGAPQQLLLFQCPCSCIYPTSKEAVRNFLICIRKQAHWRPDFQKKCYNLCPGQIEALPPPPQPWQFLRASTQGERRRTFPGEWHSGSPFWSDYQDLQKPHLYSSGLRWLQIYTGSSLQSYQCKFGINFVLHNRVVAAEELGKAIQDVIHYKTLRGKFSSVHPELRREGIVRVDVGETGLQFVRFTGSFLCKPLLAPKRTLCALLSKLYLEIFSATEGNTCRNALMFWRILKSSFEEKVMPPWNIQ